MCGSIFVFLIIFNYFKNYFLLFFFLVVILGVVTVGILQHSHSHTIDVLQYSGHVINYLTSGSCRQIYFWPYCWFIKGKMSFSCSLLVAADKITSYLIPGLLKTKYHFPSFWKLQTNDFLPYSWFITDTVPFPSTLMAAANKVTSHLFLFNSRVLFTYSCMVDGTINWFFPYTYSCR